MTVKKDGYTFGAGALLGLMASNRPLYIFAAGLLAGLALAGGIHFYRQLLELFRTAVRRTTSRKQKVAFDDLPVAAREEVPF